MGIYVREKRGRLYLDIYKGGIRRWEPTGLTIPKDAALAKEVRRMAEVIRAKREMQLVAESWDIPDPVSGKQTLVSYAEELAKDRGKDTSLPKSLAYLKEYSGTVQLAAVNERWLEGYKGFLLQTKGLGAGTARNYLQACSYVLRQAEINRKISHNPAPGVKKIQAEESIKVYLTPEDLRALASSPLKSKVGRELCMGFFFACYTGLRVSDIRSLKWGDIERNPKPHIVKRQKKTHGVVGNPVE